MATLSKFNPLAYLADSGPERFAVARVNLLLARIFAVGSIAVGLQMLLNAWGQRELLSPWIFWPGFLAVGLGQLGLIFGAFVSGKNSFWQRWYAISIGLVIVTWYFAVPPGTALGEDFYPWAWWGVGLSAVAGFGAFPPARAILLFISLDVFWFVARFFPSYGAAGLWLNLQDTLLTFLFAALFGSLIFVTRYEASKVDEASALALDAATAQARVEAAVREKARLDALVHDKVLTTLILAAKAGSAEEQQAVAEMAINAITNLNQVQNESLGGPVTGQSFFDALEKMAAGQAPDIQISRRDQAKISIPADVASALNEATLQAILNAQQHAGKGATLELHAKSNQSGIKLVVKDNGRGFRMSRVPKSRLGVRVSIIQRLQSVGGRAFVDSRPGAGTAIILEWSSNA